MGNIELKPDVLDNLIQAQTKALDTLKSAAGQRVDRVQQLCTLVGISKQTLAKALILESKGVISQTEIAAKLNIHERTLRKRNWQDVRKVPNRPFP